MVLRASVSTSPNFDKLPAAEAVSKLPSGGALVRYMDKETGVLCYILDHRDSAPSCLKVAEPETPASAPDAAASEPRS